MDLLLSRLLYLPWQVVVEVQVPRARTRAAAAVARLRAPMRSGHGFRATAPSQRLVWLGRIAHRAPPPGTNSQPAESAPRIGPTAPETSTCSAGLRILAGTR